MIDQTFAPAYGSGASVASVTATSGSTQMGIGSKSIVVTNTGANSVYVRTGLTGLTAVAGTDYIVLSLSQVSISKPQDHTHIAYVCDTALASSLHIIPGEGY
jgi:hypothetical protein